MWTAGLRLVSQGYSPIVTRHRSAGRIKRLRSVSVSYTGERLFGSLGPEARAALKLSWTHTHTHADTLLTHTHTPPADFFPPWSRWHLAWLDNWGITFALQFNMTSVFTCLSYYLSENGCWHPLMQPVVLLWAREEVGGWVGRGETWQWWDIVNDIRKGSLLLQWHSQCQEKPSCPFHSPVSNY